MKKVNLKRIIIVLCLFLCAEVCTFAYLFTSGDNSYNRNLNLGNKYLLSEDYDDAIRAFTKAIEVDEKKEDAYIGRGDAYKAKGDYASAWEDYEKAQELSGDTDLLRNKIGETKISIVSENGEGVEGASVRLNGADHNYEFITDSNGRIAEVIFPEEYKVEVKKDDYEPLRTELSAAKGGFVAEQIQLSKAEEDGLSKEDKEALLEEYKSFIAEQSDAGAYMIYDIDKDTYPELFFRYILPEEREAYYDIYTYKNRNFSLLERAYGVGFWHTLPTFASYPEGNGVIEYGAAKGKEYFSIERWIDGTRESETLYSGEFIGQYYRDAGDKAYTDSENGDAQINHQYYQSETSSPYYEGSYLLGQNSMDNYTAVYEALDAEPNNNVSQSDNEHSDSGLSFADKVLLEEEEDTSIQSITDGQIYLVRYSTFEIDDEAIGLNLTVNDNTQTFRLENLWILFPHVESVHVADIDSKDTYGNFVVVLFGEDDETLTFIYAFNNGEIKQIGNYRGRLVPDSISDNASIRLTYNLGMGVPGFGCFTMQPEIIVSGMNTNLGTIHYGRTVYTEGDKAFEEGLWPTIHKDLIVYEDSSFTTVSGMIPAGSLVSWEYIGYEEGLLSETLFVKSGDTQGYVLFHDLRSATFTQ